MQHEALLVQRKWKVQDKNTAPLRFSLQNVVRHWVLQHQNEGKTMERTRVFNSDWVQGRSARHVSLFKKVNTPCWWGTVTDHANELLQNRKLKYTNSHHGVLRKVSQKASILWLSYKLMTSIRKFVSLRQVCPHIHSSEEHRIIQSTILSSVRRMREDIERVRVLMFLKKASWGIRKTRIWRYLTKLRL